MPTRLPALLPAGYLTVTRYPGVLPVVGFVWLELLPFTAYLYFVVGLKALLYPVLHIVFLGLYELGYVFNDRAQTASERTGRGKYTLAGQLLRTALLVRMLLFVIAIALIAHHAGIMKALNFAVFSLGIVVLLFAHTWLGERSQPLSRLRIISFAWLASGKYAPAALALVTLEAVVPPLVVIFLVYGAARVVDYTVNKVSALDVGIPEVYSLWYVAALPAAISMCLYSGSTVAGLAILGVFAAYYVVSSAKRAWGVFRDARKRINRIDA